jgi:hypothetical protein
MRLPGFDAASSLYRSNVHYKVAVGGESAFGTTGFLRTPAASAPPSGRYLSDVIIHPFPHVLCQPCAPDDSGACTQYCVFCPGSYPGEGCRASFIPCAAGECCPSGQELCYVAGKSKSCCGENETCCNPETGFCCPACGNACAQGDTCCNGNCIPPTSQLKSWSQYFVYEPACQPIEGLAVIFDAAQDPMTSSTGFSVQLNAFQQGTLGNWLQFIFFIDGSGGISANIQDHTTSPLYPGGSSSYANFSKNNQNLTIQLTCDSDGAVNGAVFRVCDSSGCESHSLDVPNSAHHTINAFQVNVVFDPGGPPRPTRLSLRDQERSLIKYHLHSNYVI